jgi:hypothetical protein
MGNEGTELWMPLCGVLTIPMREGKMEPKNKAEAIDRKFKFTAVSQKSGKKYTHNNAIVFLAKDALLPDLLDKYLELCSQKGVDTRQLTGVSLLKDRVLAWQRRNHTKIHAPDVEVGKEEARVCKANK